MRFACVAFSATSRTWSASASSGPVTCYYVIPERMTVDTLTIPDDPDRHRQAPLDIYLRGYRFQVFWVDAGSVRTASASMALLVPPVTEVINDKAVRDRANKVFVDDSVRFSLPAAAEGDPAVAMYIKR